MIVTRGDGPHLRDPNWYRVRYALAVQCLEIATVSASTSGSREPAPAPPRKGKALREFLRRGSSGKGGEPGWPAGIESSEWRDSFGEETADLLGELYEKKAPGKAHFEEGAAAAKEEAEDLVASAAGMLQKAGWQWVGRKPPRFVRWRRAISPLRILHRRGVLDRELVLFLSWVVEPASVALLFSAWLVEGTSFPMERLKLAIGPRLSDSFEPLDRRNREAEGVDWLIAYLARLVYDSRVDTARSARALAILGRTRLRPPREPSFRVQYSLACLFSRLAIVAAKDQDDGTESQFVSIAAAQLERAIFRLPDEQRGRLVGWAKVDPGLAGLRLRRKHEFAEIVARWGASDKEEVVVEGSGRIDRIKYDPGAEILDIEFSDGLTKRYGGVPETVPAKLIGSESEEGEETEKDQQKAEDEFLETIEKEYPPIRP